MSKTVGPNEYECAMCGGVFEKAWSEEEARAEYVNNFGTTVAESDDGVIVCDDCYKEIDPQKHPDKVAATVLGALVNKP